MTECSPRRPFDHDLIAFTLAGLQTRGLLGRRPDPDDGRRSVLLITEAGRAALRDKDNARNGAADQSPLEWVHAGRAAAVDDRSSTDRAFGAVDLMSVWRGDPVGPSVGQRRRVT